MEKQFSRKEGSLYLKNENRGRWNRIISSLFAGIIAIKDIHANAEVAQIPESLKWEDILPYMLEKQKNEQREQIVGGIISDQEVKWVPIPIESASEGSVSIQKNYMKEDFLKKMSASKDNAYGCLLHTHPDGNENFALPPSGVDFVFGSHLKNDLNQDIPLRTGAITSQGIYYFGAYEKDVFDEYNRMRDDVISKTLDIIDEERLQNLYTIIQLRNGTETFENTSIKEMKDAVSRYFHGEKVGGELSVLFFVSQEMRRLYERTFLRDVSHMHSSQDMSVKEKATVAQNIVLEWTGTVRTMLSLPQNPFSIRTDSMADNLRQIGFDIRFVPQEFFAEEPPCAGLSYNAQYEYTDGRWKRIESVEEDAKNKR